MTYIYPARITWVTVTARNPAAQRRLRTPVVRFQRQLERIMREQLIRMCTQLSGRPLPAASQIYARSHSYTRVTTGNLQTRQQMGTETHQYL
jgi:hypothetical protein